MTNFQRPGSISNSHVGRDFENLALAVLTQHGFSLDLNHSVDVGLGTKKKAHKFDLGSNDPAVMVECKAQTWTSGDIVPNAKLKNWSEAMFYFAIAPQDYRKIFFIQKSVRRSNGETLGDYYLRTHYHLIPEDVEFWECDPETKVTRILEKELA